MRVVFDLDGTLADDSHRLHLIAQERPEWDMYMNLCDLDTPISHTALVLRSMYSTGHEIEVWTGRPEGENGKFREKTMDWFEKNRGAFLHRFVVRTSPTFRTAGAPPIVVRMRPHGNYTKNADLKRGWLELAREQGVAPHLVFEDQQDVVDMWRAEGIPCFQVAKREEF